VLSQWKEHCNLLAEGLRSRGFAPVVLEGGLGKRARAALLDTIERTPLSEPLVVVATGQYLGEGFDCPQLDTLFLAYTGRLLRAHDNKVSVCVYDYADVRVPVLRAMHTRRLATYKQLGFSENDQTAASRQLAVPILAA
jgi:superfamily II DNA or RNA helicase